MTITGDWAEGDALTPTNLSGKGGGNFPDRMYNAGWARFGSPNVVKEVRIQAAINQAAADGVSVVFIPASMLPYDASAVTFNTGVHMLAEGASQSLEEYDVRAYGASTSGDALAGVQAAFDIAASGAAATSVKTVRFGPGRYTCSRPIWGRYARVVGEGPFINNLSGWTQLSGSFHSGPILLVQNSSATIPNLTTSLVTGSGQAVQYTDNTMWFNLRDSKQLDVNGLGSFTAECFFKSSDQTGGARVLISSRGRYLTRDTQGNAFALFVQFDEKFFFTINLTGGRVTLQNLGPVLTDGAVHHLAASYDGTTVRTFVDGVLIASGAGSGTIVQDEGEAVTIGLDMDRPEANQWFGNPHGTLDSIRISNNCRYTVGFTKPTAKFANDGNTLCLMNFDLQIGAATRAYSKNGDLWLVQRVSNAGQYGGGPLTIENVAFVDGAGAAGQFGIYLYHNVYNWTMSRVQFYYLRGGMICPTGNAYSYRFANSYLIGTTGSRFGFWLSANAGIGHWDSVWTQQCKVHFVCQCADLTLTNWFFQMDTACLVGAIYHDQSNNSNGVVLNSCVFNTEPGVSSSYRGGLAFGGIGLGGSGVMANGCAFETGNNAPFLLGDNVKKAQFNICNFTVAGSPSSVMSFSGTLGRPVEFNNCDQAGTHIPWSDVPGTAVVGKIGKGPAIAFSTPLTLDCSLRDDFELGALTGAITINFSNVTPGQKISLWTVQNAGGGNAITFGTVNGSGAVKGATANDTTGLHYSQYLFDCNLNGNMTQIGFSSGA